MKVFLAVLCAAGLLAGAAQEKAEPKQQKADPKAPAKTEKAEKPAPEAAKPPAPPPPPQQRRESNYVYDIQGRPVPGNPASRDQRTGTGAGSTVDREQTLRGPDGRPVTYRSEREKVLSESESEHASERHVQRYDPNGRPTSKQVIRAERRKTPDGSMVTTETLYEQDLNGRLQLAERRTTRETKTPAGGATALQIERPGLGGSLQVVERGERVETKRSESVTETVGSRKFPDANGRWEEREREMSVATKSGEVTSTETKQWRLGAAGSSAQMDLVSRAVSRLTEKPDGSQVEDVEVYSSLIAGTTSDLNRPQTPGLEQQVRREKKVQADGRIVETTSTRARQVAEPSRLGGLTVEEQVTTPTTDGKTIQKTLYERDTNGRLRPVASSVEEQKK